MLGGVSGTITLNGSGGLAPVCKTNELEESIWLTRESLGFEEMNFAVGALWKQVDRWDDRNRSASRVLSQQRVGSFLTMSLLMFQRYDCVLDASLQQHTTRL